MDENTFDRLAASLVSRLNRRALGGMTAGMAAAIGFDPADAKKKKKKGKKRRSSTTPSPTTSTSTTPAPICTPRCNGKVCGPDSCGDVCGSCGPNATCNSEGQCRVNDNYTLAKTWSTRREGDGQYPYVQGVALDRDGNVFVVDAGQKCVRKFTRDGGFVTQWGTYGSDDGQFGEPSGVAVGPDNAVYVTDSRHNRVQKFRVNAQDPFQYDFVTKWGSEGMTAGSFRNPQGIAVDSTGNVFVADLLLGSLQKFRPAGDTYEFVKGVPAETEWVAIDRTDSVYVSVGRGGTGFKLNIFSNDLTLIKERSWQLSPPLDSSKGIAVDDDLNIFIAQNNRRLLHKFDSEGNHLYRFNASVTGLPAGAPNTLPIVSCVAVDPAGNVYVSSSSFTNPEIGVFVPPTTARARASVQTKGSSRKRDTRGRERSNAHGHGHRRAARRKH